MHACLAECELKIDRLPKPDTMGVLCRRELQCERLAAVTTASELGEGAHCLLQSHVGANVTVGEDTIVEYCRIGDGARVGASSVVSCAHVPVSNTIY